MSSHNRSSSPPTTRRTGIDIDRREVIGRHHTVEVAERNSLDTLVRTAEPLQHGHGMIAVEHVEQRELHVREHEHGVALRDQQPPTRTGRVDGERATVHDPSDTTVERIDPGGGPGKIGERQPGHDAQCDVGVSRAGTGDGRTQHRDGALGNGRVAGHRVEHLAVLDRRGKQRGHDRRVDPIEIGLGVVTVVEALERHARRREFVDGRVAGGPHEADGCCRDRVARRRHDQVGTGRPQTNNGDNTRAAPPWPQRLCGRSSATGNGAVAEPFVAALADPVVAGLALVTAITA